MTDTRVSVDGLNAARTYVRLVRALEDQVRREGARDNLTLTEFGVLGHINRGHTLPSMIARAMELDPGRVTRITDRLFALGYVRRETDPEDRRRCPLVLTETGERRMEDGKTKFADAMATILEGLTEEELEGLRIGSQGLARVLDARSERTL